MKCKKTIGYKRLKLQLKTAESKSERKELKGLIKKYIKNKC